MTAADAPEPDQTTRPDRRRTVLVAAVTLVVLAVLALTAWLTGRDDDPADAASAVASATASTAPAPATTAPAAGGDAAPPADGAPAPEVPAEVPVLDPVSLDETADFGDGITAGLASVRAVEGSGSGAGEIAAPSLAVEVELTNGTGDDLALDTVVVNTSFGADDTPASPLFGDPSSEPFSGVLAAGERARGTYLFVVPTDQRDAVAISVSHSSLSPVVVFEGAAPR